MNAYIKGRVPQKGHSIMSLTRFLFHHVIDNIYLGNILSVDKDVIDAYGIGVIVNASQTDYETAPGVISYPIDLPDHPEADIAAHFDEVYDIVCRHADRKVLIHCMGGVSRSVALVLAVLVRKGIMLKQGLDLLRSQRCPTMVPPQPNLGFVEQLAEHERKYCKLV